MPLVEASVGPKTVERADRQFLELHGSAMVWNTYFKIALLVVGAVALGLVALLFQTQAQLQHVRPMVIRIDSIGRAEASTYDAATTYTPQVAELRYFLKQFIVMHLSRVKSTLVRDFPQSLLFLDPALRATAMNHMTEGQMLQKYLESMATEEVEIDIKNIVFSEIRSQPYRAQVDFLQQPYAPNSHANRPPTLWTGQVEMTRLPPGSVPNDWSLINPLGFQISYFRVDQATSDRLK